MGWGDFLGNSATQATGNPLYQLAGNAFDLYNAGQDNERDSQFAGQLQKEQLQIARDNVALQYQDRAENLSMKERLIEKSNDLKAVNDQVVAYLGLPYTPTQENLINSVMERSEDYTGDVMKLATLMGSKTRAANMYQLGGADSSTMSNDITRGIVDKYAPELNKARRRAEEDELTLVGKRIQTDKAVRDNMLDTYATPINNQISRESQMKNVSSSFPNDLNAMATAAAQGHATSQKALATYFANAKKNINTPSDLFGGKSAMQQLGESFGLNKNPVGNGWPNTPPPGRVY